MSFPVTIVYPCGCIEYDGVTGKDRKPKTNILCQLSKGQKAKAVDTGQKDGQGKKIFKAIWECPRQQQREEPVPKAIADAVTANADANPNP